MTNRVYINLLFSAFIGYLAYHAFSGERGIIALVKLTNDNTKLYKELENIKAERIRLEHKVTLMRSDSLDLDLLEEQAKSVLGLINKEEKIIFD
jgi:cell division protein FtsB